MRFPFHPVKYALHTWRAILVQPFFWAVFFLSPVFNWFRVDVMSQRIIFLGNSYPFEHQYVMWLPIGFYLGVLLIAVATAFMGRVFCGWSCPHNTLTEWTRPFRMLVGREQPSVPWKRFFKNHPVLRPFLVIASIGLAFVIAFVLSGLLAGFLVPPQWILDGYLSGAPNLALVFGQILFTMLGVFLLYCGHDFCRTCCPYGMAQSISAYQSGKFKPMEIAYKGDKATQCKTCTVCQQVCPVDIDPRSPVNLKVGQFDGCFNCGKCIDACQYLQNFKQGEGLLSFARPRR
jgi:polyferredoxin